MTDINNATSDVIYINIHFPSLKEAKDLGKELLLKKLCGTVKITPNVHLMYILDEKFGNEDTYLMTIKTTNRHLKDIEIFILENHSWGTPCIEVVPIQKDHC